MSWTTADALNSLDLSDVATFAKVENEVPSPFSDFGVSIPGRDGVQFDDDAPFAPLVASLRLHLRWTNSARAITHADGEVGHIRENLSLVKKELNKPAPIWSRTLEHIGDVRAVVKSNTPGFVGEQRHVHIFPLTVPSGSWQDATESDSGAASTTPSVTTDGDRRIHDPRIQFAAAGTFTHTQEDGRTATVTVASGPTFPVDVYIAGVDGVSDLYAEDAGAVDVTGDVSLSRAYGLRFEADTALTLSSTSNVVVFWRNRWS